MKKVYYKLKKTDLIEVLCDMSLKPNYNNIYLTKIYDAENIFIEINIKKSFDIIKLTKLNCLNTRIINLDDLNFKIFVPNLEIKKAIINFIMGIKEIKLASDISNLIFINDSKIYDNEKFVFKSKYLNNDSDLKNNYIKGLIYGSLYNNTNLNNYILNTYTKYYDEYSIAKKMYTNIESKHGNKNLIKCSKDIFKALESKVNRDLTNASYKNLIFNNLTIDILSLNENVLMLEKNDIELLDFILNILVYQITEVVEPKQRIIKMIEILGQNIHSDILKQDLRRIYKRIKTDDLDIKINEIENIVLKNLLVVGMKINNLKELFIILKEKKVEKSNIAYILLGTVLGYRKLPRVICQKRNKVLLDSIALMEESINPSIKTHRDIKLSNMYYLERLYQKYSNGINIKDDEIAFKLENNICMIDLNGETIELNCNYYTRSENYARSFKYYDEQVQDIQNKYKDFKKMKNIYYSYNFSINGQKKCIDYRLEGLFNSILKNIWEALR